MNLTAKQWFNIQHNLHCHADRQTLLNAIADWTYKNELDQGTSEQIAVTEANRRYARLSQWPKDSLAEICLGYVKPHSKDKVQIGTSGVTVYIELGCGNEDCSLVWRHCS